MGCFAFSVQNGQPTRRVGMTQGTNEMPSEANQSIYIDGYFTECVRKGEKPSYGYPTNHLPAVGTHSMEVKTGFIETVKSK